MMKCLLHLGHNYATTSIYSIDLLFNLCTSKVNTIDLIRKGRYAHIPNRQLIKVSMNNKISFNGLPLLSARNRVVA